MSVTAAAGFVASGVACGVKESGAPDLALVATADRRAVPVAAVVTANKAKAAPVLITLTHLAASGGHATAVVLNSGNANAATGATGREAAQATCTAVSAELGCSTEEVLVCSTGLIGIPLPVERILEGIPKLATDLSSDGAGAALAILTTDTRVKESVRSGDGWTVGGMAKGAAMLSPRLAPPAPHATTGGGPAPHATMLAVLTTDAEVDHATLRSTLTLAAERSFNTIDVDGATSTNDTVILMASGLAGPPASMEAFVEAVTEVCRDLADQMVADAEGATKRARITVSGAASPEDAAVAARAVAQSQLVQCSFHGGDPYWGRVVSELGASGAAFNPELVSVAYGGVTVCAAGTALDHDAHAVAEHMQGRELEVVADLGLGTSSATVTTTDLSPAYIAENMRTS
ncbi:MAG TPA: bifunctional glutamate N-acetyltransferase/amino-acid acetyltransferase ArgJ [Acidimicrobiales bacterium]|nr:bifunctional glutamate N-acetyltransferase/amino-acid acetyltransferase ArgJ [Acidimicrobiales bacterium]